MTPRRFARAVLLALAFASAPAYAKKKSAAPPLPADPVKRLAAEVHARGFIVYAASDKNSWDLYLMRPDGSDRRNISNTADTSEAAGRFSPDGRQMLFYRMPKGTVLDNNKYGTYELMIGNADGSGAVSYGTVCPWASWAPDGKTLTCLAKEGVLFFDPTTRKVTRQMDRKGIVEQLFQSADGKWLTGTANGLGEHWNIARMNAATGELNRVSDGNCFNCTPDWLPDGKNVLYSKGHPCTEGWAQLWTADGEGKTHRMLYGEIKRHIYGGGISPDGKYLVFTRSQEDLGKVDHSETTMVLMRFADAPIVGGTESEVLHKQYPQAQSGPILDLGPGWEPHWTFAEIAPPAKP